MIFYTISKSNPGYEDTENQSELPIKSIPWIKDTIEIGFWRNPSEGGLPKNQHAVRSTFENEDILISRTMNASYGEPGFNIVNKSRRCYIISSMDQEMQITDKLLKSDLLALFDEYIPK